MKNYKINKFKNLIIFVFTYFILSISLSYAEGGETGGGGASRPIPDPETTEMSEGDVFCFGYENSLIHSVKFSLSDGGFLQFDIYNIENEDLYRDTDSDVVNHSLIEYYNYKENGDKFYIQFQQPVLYLDRLLKFTLHNRAIFYGEWQDGFPDNGTYINLVKYDVNMFYHKDGVATKQYVTEFFQQYFNTQNDFNTFDKNLKNDFFTIKEKFDELAYSTDDRGICVNDDLPPDFKDDLEQCINANIDYDRIDRINEENLNPVNRKLDDILDYIDYNRDMIDLFKTYNEKLDKGVNENLKYSKNLESSLNSLSKSIDTNFLILNEKIDNLENVNINNISDGKDKWNDIKDFIDSYDDFKENTTPDGGLFSKISDFFKSLFDGIGKIFDFFKDFFTITEEFDFHKINTEGLGNKIPFSIFNDITNLFKSFLASPEAPVFSFKLITVPVTIDFNNFVELAKIIRIGSFVFFVFFLVIKFYNKVA